MDFNSLRFRMIPTASAMPPAGATDQPQQDGLPRRSLFDRIAPPRQGLDHDEDERLDVISDKYVNEHEEDALQDETHEPALLKRISSPSQHRRPLPTLGRVSAFESILAQPALKPASQPDASAPGLAATAAIPPSATPVAVQSPPNQPSASEIRDALLFFGEVYADAYSVANEWGEHADTLKRVKAQKEDIGPKALQQDSAAEPAAKRQKTSHTGSSVDTVSSVHRAETSMTSTAPPLAIPAISSLPTFPSAGTFVPPKGLFSGLTAASTGQKRSHAEMTGQSNTTASGTSHDKTAPAMTAPTKQQNIVHHSSPSVPPSTETLIAAVSLSTRPLETPASVSHTIEVKDEPQEPVLYSISQLRDSRKVQEVAAIRAVAKDEKPPVVETQPQKIPAISNQQPALQVDEESLKQLLLARRQRRQEQQQQQTQIQPSPQLEPQRQVDVLPRQGSLPLLQLPPQPTVSSTRQPSAQRKLSGSTRIAPNLASLPPRPVSTISLPRTAESVPGSPSARSVVSTPGPATGEHTIAPHATGSSSKTMKMSGESTGSTALPAMSASTSSATPEAPVSTRRRPPLPFSFAAKQPISSPDSLSPATSTVSVSTPVARSGFPQSRYQGPDDDTPSSHQQRRLTPHEENLNYSNPGAKSMTGNTPGTGGDENTLATAPGSTAAPSATTIPSKVDSSSTTAAIVGSSSKATASSTPVGPSALPATGSATPPSDVARLSTSEATSGIKRHAAESKDDDEPNKRKRQIHSTSPPRLAPPARELATAPVSQPQLGDRRVSASQLTAPAPLPPLPPRPPSDLGQPARFSVSVPGAPKLPPKHAGQVDELPRRVMRPGGQPQPPAPSAVPGAHQSLGLRERFTVTDRLHPPPSQRYAREQSQSSDDYPRDTSVSSSSPAPKASLADRIQDFDEHAPTLSDRMSPTHAQQQDLASRIGTKRARDDFEHPYSDGAGPSKKRRAISVASSTSGPGNDLAGRIGSESHHQQYLHTDKWNNQSQQHDSPQYQQEHKSKNKLEARMNMSDFGSVIDVDALDSRISGYAGDIPRGRSGYSDSLTPPQVYLRSLSPPEERIHPHAKQPSQQAARGGRGRGNKRSGMPPTRGGPHNSRGGRGGPPQSGGRGGTPTARGHAGSPPGRGHGKGKTSLKNRISTE